MINEFMKKLLTQGNNRYQKFLIRLFLLFITVIVFDFIIGSLLGLFYFKQNSGFLYRTTYAIEKTTQDVIIFGSSTATHDYHPGIFEERLNLSYYNVGRDGNTILYDYAILKSILKRYTPKIVILDFDINEFRKTLESYDRLSPLLPYYKTHPEIHSIVELKSPYEKYKLLSKIYPYNSLIFSMIGGNMEYFNVEYFNNRQRNRDMNTNGYFPLTSVWKEPKRKEPNSINYELDSNKIKMYEGFIKDCIGSKTELYIVCSPIFIKRGYVSPSIDLGEEIAKKYNVSFLDYSKDSTLLNTPKLFADMVHLNNDGAKAFSDKLIDTILQVSKGFNQKQK